MLDLITVKFLGSFSTKPIYIFGGLGLASALGAVLMGLIMLYQKFLAAQELPLNRNPLLILTAVLIMSTVQFILMGLACGIAGEDVPRIAESAYIRDSRNPRMN